jgi:hypothetical protein
MMDMPHILVVDDDESVLIHYQKFLTYQIVRDRHDAGADAPYVLEATRVIRAMGEACAELVGAGEVNPDRSFSG